MPISAGLRACGSNGSGQLGIGHTNDVYELTSCIIEGGEPHGEYDRAVPWPSSMAAGGNHTLISFGGKHVYAAGDNSDGRCGVAQIREGNELYKNLTTFYPVTVGGEGEIHYIAATWEASIFVTKDGEVYTCGTGNNGELGLGEGITSAAVPRKIPGFPPKNKGICRIASSMGHVVVTLWPEGSSTLERKEVWGWGAGRKGQLGEPKQKAIWSPRRIKPPKDSNGNRWVFDVQCVTCCRDYTYIAGPDKPEHPSKCYYSLHGPQDAINFKALAGEHPSPTRLCATWKGIYMQRDQKVLGWGDRPRLPAKVPPIRNIVAGSEHVLIEQDLNRPFGRILASGWGEHGNCGSPVNGEGESEGWNELAASGHLVGAGCATSFILVNDLIRSSYQRFLNDELESQQCAEAS